MKPESIFFISLLFILSCEDKVDKDTTPPTVIISSPEDNSSVSGEVSILCISNDNEGVDKVELWVNGESTGLIDESEPYSFIWNSKTYDDGSYVFIVRSYDNSGNTSNSEPITLLVENTIRFLKLFSESYEGRYVQQTDDGGYVVIGGQETYTTTYFLKTDSLGNEEWSRTFSDFVGHTFQQTTDGGYIFKGVLGNWETKLVKTNSQCDIEWVVTYHGFLDNVNYIYSIQETDDGGYVITGSDDVGLFLMKYDSQGNELWYKNIYYNFISTPHSGSKGLFVQQMTDGGYKLIGTFNSSSFWIIKTDSDGLHEWSTLLDLSDMNIYPQYSSYPSIQTTDDGGNIISVRDDTDELLLKIDTDGYMEWYNNYEGGEMGFRGQQSVQQTNDGGYIIISGTVLIKTDSNGNEEWNKSFNNNSSSWGMFGQQTTDSGYIITGRMSSYGEIIMFLMKTDKFGNIDL